MFRNSSDFRDDRDKIMVTIPPGNDMEMEVISNTCSCNFPEVAADIETIWVEMLFEYFGRLLDEKHEVAVFCYC